MPRATPYRSLALLLLLAAPTLAQQPARYFPPVGTSFDAALDGMPFDNFGDATSPDGNCFGMSLLAIDNYRQRMARRAAGEPDPQPQPIARDPMAGHIPQQILASLAQVEAERKDEQENDPEVKRPVSDPRDIEAALERIMRTGVPELMGIYGKGDTGHATVLHGYDGSNLLIYDPNYPGELVRWPWSPTKGLGKHPKARDDELYRTVRQYGATPFDKFAVTKDLQALRQACAAGEDRCLARFPEVRADLIRADGKLFAEGQVLPATDANQDAPWREKVQRPARAWVTLDGQPFATARIDKDGRFKVKLPGKLPPGKLNVVAVTKDSGGLAAYGALSRDEYEAPAASSKGYLSRLRW